MKYSRSKINKAGTKLMTSKVKEEVEDAMAIIKDWRDLHMRPLMELKQAVESILKEENILHYPVSNRLKRIESIQLKLDVSPDMRLGGVHDIGGLRVVLYNIEDLFNFKQLLQTISFENFERKDNIYDYVENPKPSTGYRSIHFVYKYRSANSDYDGLLDELQIRTKLQHCWAMAVETMGLCTKTSLKSNQGRDIHLDFFRIVSALYALKEDQPISENMRIFTMKDLMAKCYKIDNALEITKKLSAISVSINKVEKSNINADYYVLNIDLDKRLLNIRTFENFEEASALYSKLEEKENEENRAVVLVSVDEIKELRETYPSFFLDTKDFIESINKIKKNCEILKYI